jgi:chromosome segregation ATPase
MHTTELKRLLREVARLNASVQHLTRDNEHLKQKNRNLGEAERDLREQIRQARLATASRRFARGVVAAVDARRNSARIDSAYGCVPPRGIKVGEVVEFEVNAEPSKSGAPGNVINVRKCR